MTVNEDQCCLVDFHPQNPGLFLTGTQMSHCWHQEGHSAKIDPVHQKNPNPDTIGAVDQGHVGALMLLDL